MRSQVDPPAGLRQSKSEAPHPLSGPRNVPAAHDSHTGSCSKDTALRGQRVIETIWAVEVTEPS